MTPQYAVNKDTGEVMKNDGGGWSKVQSARNAEGVVLINENGQWGEVPQAQPNEVRQPSGSPLFNAVQSAAPSPEETARLQSESKVNAAADMFSMSPMAERVGAFGAGSVNAATFGNLDNANALVGKVLEGGSFADNKREAQGVRQQLRDDYPVSSTAGAIHGFLAPGGLVAGAGKQVAARVPQASGQGLAYTQRLLGLGALGATENALYEGTVGASGRGAEQRRDVGVAESLEMAKDGGTNPLAWVAGPAASAVYRGGRRLLTGSFTPNNVATPTSRTMEEVLDATPDEVSVKSFRLIENLLRNAGLSGDRIRTGFERLSQVKASGSEPRASLARLIEREFANESPEISQNLRAFLMKVGLDSGEGRAIVTSATDALRKTQADDLRGQAAYELGSQPRIEAAGQAKANMESVGALYDDALRQAPRDGELVEAAKQMMQGYPRELQAAIGQKARAAQLSPDQYVEQNPLAALHWMQSLIKQSEKPIDQAVAANMTDILDNAVPGYRGLRNQYADQATRRDLVGYVDQGGRESKGFGTDLVNKSGKELTADNMVERYQGLKPEHAQAADLSIRDAITDPLRLGKATGVDEFGRDMAGARLATLQREGVVDTMGRMLGGRGERLGNQIRSFIDERQFAADIDPRTGSNTMNKANAQATGAAPVSGYLGRSMGGADGSVAPSLLLDSALALTGNVPVATLARGLPPALGRMFQPRLPTRNALADVLLRDAAGSDPTRAMFTPRGGVPPVNALNDGQLGNNRPPPPMAGDPMRPASGPIPGGPGDGGLPSGSGTNALADLEVVSRVPAPQRPQTLIGFIKSMGGVNDEGGEISAILGGTNTVPGVISDVRRSGPKSVSGVQIDYMLEAAIEEGFLPPGASRNDLLDALSNDVAAVGDDLSRVYPEYGNQGQAVNEFRARLEGEPTPRNALADAPSVQSPVVAQNALADAPELKQNGLPSTKGLADKAKSALRGEVKVARQSGYEGADKGEAKEWIRAKAKGLDMSQKARMARAKAMGFDKTAFRGLRKSVFRGGLSNSDKSGGGRWFSDNAATSETYAAGNLDTQDSLMMKVQLKLGKKLEIDAKGAFAKDLVMADLPADIRKKVAEISGSNSGLVISDEVADAAEALGYDSVVFNNMIDTFQRSDAAAKPATVYAILNQSNIRSVNAAFDPDFSDSSDLLAAAPFFAVAGAGGSANALSETED